MLLLSRYFLSNIFRESIGALICMEAKEVVFHLYIVNSYHIVLEYFELDNLKIFMEVKIKFLLIGPLTGGTFQDSQSFNW